jgi:hypothetical protein
MLSAFHETGRFSEATDHPISILMLFLHLPSSAQKQDLSSCTTEDTIIFGEGWVGRYVCI